MVSSDLIKEISLNELEGLRVGNVQNEDAGTGVTALVFEHGAAVGCDISGGGPASRETPLTSPVTADNPVNAILLSGGSAFGLAASDGAMRYLEEHKLGFDTGFAVVPLVCQSCIFDLGYKRSDVRPDAAMGYAACQAAFEDRAVGGCAVDGLAAGDGTVGGCAVDGLAAGGGAVGGCAVMHASCGLTHNNTQVGAGCGATVGKLCGMERSTKSGIGYYAVRIGALKMAAIVVVNALGDIHDPDNGTTLAGLRSTFDMRAAGFEDTAHDSIFGDSVAEMLKFFAPQNLFTGNTTIGTVITNARFSKAELTKIASMTRTAYSRCIRPVATMADGDTIYAASCGDVIADINMVGTLAAEVMGQAIVNAVK